METQKEGGETTERSILSQPVVTLCFEAHLIFMYNIYNIYNSHALWSSFTQ